MVLSQGWDLGWGEDPLARLKWQYAAVRELFPGSEPIPRSRSFESGRHEIAGHLGIGIAARGVEYF